MSTAVAEFDQSTKELGDKIVGLTLLQAKQVVSYLKEVHGIERRPAARLSCRVAVVPQRHRRKRRLNLT